MALYIQSDDYLDLYEPRKIISYTYIKKNLCYYVLITLDKPIVSVHPICGKIETVKIIVQARGINCLWKLKFFPIEVCVFAPDYLDKNKPDRCKYVLSIANLYNEV